MTPNRLLLLFAFAVSVSLIHQGSAQEPAPSSASVSTTAPATRPAYAAAEAAKHVGEDAVVTGLVAGVATSKQGNTYMNFGAAFPNHVFSGSVHADNAAKVGDLKQYQGKTLAVTGKIELYNGKPQIVITSQDQIKVVEAGVSAAPAVK